MPFTFPSSSTVSFAADAADAAEALFAELLPLSLPHPVNIDATITAVKTAATAFLFMIFPSCVVPAAFSRRKRFCLSVVRTLYLHTAVSRAADKSLKKLLLVNQPFMDPIITPFTKCFCTSGYITRTGRLLMMISEYFITSISCCFSCSAALAAAVVAV